jgi:hypothetical protein
MWNCNIKLNRRSLLAAALMGLGALACAQEAQTGITVPATITGGFMKSDDAYFGYHAAVYPALRLDDHWFVYAAVDLYSTPFFYYPEYNGREWAHAGLEQAYVARTWKNETSGWVVKAGKLSSAFGGPQRQYDDMQNALLDQPLSFTSALPLYPSLNVCSWGGRALCFDYTSAYYAYAPVTLYGLWGGEAAGWWKRLDGRVQLANSSPENPLPLSSGDQHAQWSAGGGYTVAPGFRIGVSGFRGSWLNAIPGANEAGISTWAPPATGLGADAEWARGRWKVRSEWQRLTFPYPAAYQTAVPAAAFAWTETRLIITPRLYAAVRVGYQRASGFGAASLYAPNLARYEVAMGFRPNRCQLVKAGYEWNQLGSSAVEMDNVLGVQLVTALPAFTRALR